MPLRTKSFVVKEGEMIDNGAGVGVLLNWWEEIDELEQYALVSFTALVLNYLIYFFVYWDTFIYIFYY